MDNRRKTVLINRRFQIKMISKFIILNIVLMIIFSIMVYIFTNSEIDSNFNKAHITYNNVREMLLPIVITLSVINIFISTIIIAGFVLFASFRIAGPLYRFNQIVHDLGERKFNTITTLRKNDQLYACSVSLEETVGILSDDLESMKKAIEGIDADLDQAPGSAKEKIQSLKDIINRYTLK